MSRTYESPSRKAQAEETRRRILLALVDLIVEERPATVSIPQVARRAGVSVRIVYHYFPTKEVLFDSLTESMDDLVAAPDERPAVPASPAELVAAIPLIFRFFDANSRVFRALGVSEMGDQVRARRRQERAARAAAALEPLRDRLDEEEHARLRAVVGLLTSFDGFDTLTSGWGLSVEEAAATAAWSVRTLCERARRSGVVA